MAARINPDLLERTFAFHGHICPGLATGIRVAEIALREIGAHAQDEEIVAIAETNNCAVDAIQFLTGCTLGKGNLIHPDHGKNVFTFARRSDGKAIRITSKPRPERALDPEQESLLQRVFGGEASAAERETFTKLWQQRAFAILAADEDDLFDVELLDNFELPDKAGLHPSVRCDRCGTLTMAPRIHRYRGKNLCIPCYLAAVASAVVMHPIGVVRNDPKSGQKSPRARSAPSTIIVGPQFRDAIDGLEPGQRLQIIFAFDRAPENAPLQQHPRGNRDNPKRGVFALRSPHRPNPIGLTTVELLSIKDNVLKVSGLDAWDGTPVLDIKPYVASLDS